MFNVIFKKSKIVLDCFTKLNVAYELSPISKADKYFPDWWKRIPQATYSNDIMDNIPVSTMKHCTGLIDYFRQGFVLPLWCDLILKTTNNGISYQFADQVSQIISHSPVQFNNSFPNHIHVKIVSPWYVKSNSNINFHCSSPFWNLFPMKDFVDNFHIVPGVVNLNNFTEFNVNAFLAKKDHSYFLNHNTPIYYFYPNTDKQVELKTHLIDDVEYRKLQTKNNRLNFTFNKKEITYRKLKK